MSKEEFLSKYLQRLKLDPALYQEPEATIDKLRILQEAHLAQIPFENLSQHGCPHPATVLDLHQTADKILNQHRGGFCFEVNGLFSELLIQLGYTVGRVPAHVYRNATHYVEVPTHMILMVSCEDSPATWLVDVGFGEPPIHPLDYTSSWDQVQITPEGMQSKLVQKDKDVILYWWSHSTQTWIPRLKWDFDASHLLGENSPSLADFASGLATVLHRDSIFSQKLICCRITQEKKYTIAGHRFKITGAPRFPGETDYAPPVQVDHIDSPEELRVQLRDQFGIPMAATVGLDLQASLAADPMIWSHMC